MSVVLVLIRVWHNIICINMVGHNDKCYQCDVPSKLQGDSNNCLPIACDARCTAIQ